MGIELPPELAAIAAAVGVRWPEADEDAMRASAGAWRDTGTRVSAITTEADNAARTALSGVVGDAGDSANRHWSTFVAADSGHLTSAVKGCSDAADRLDHAADQIAAAKSEIIRHLVSLAKTKDAAEAAAGAGHPNALLGLTTALHGTAANIAGVKDTLVAAVQPGGPDVRTIRDLVNTAPGAIPAPNAVTGLAGGVTHAVAGTTTLVSTTTDSTVGAVQQQVTGAVSHAPAIVDQTQGAVRETTGMVDQMVSGETASRPLAAIVPPLDQQPGQPTPPSPGALPVEPNPLTGAPPVPLPVDDTVRAASAAVLDPPIAQPPAPSPAAQVPVTPPPTAPPPIGQPTGLTPGTAAPPSTTQAPIPAARPPAGQPPNPAPSAQAPAGQIPTGQAPASKAPTGQPPAGQIPIGQAPAAKAPTGQAPAGQMPTGQPPAGKAPTGQPPAGQMPTGQPLAGQAPAGQAPGGQASPTAQSQGKQAPAQPATSGKPLAQQAAAPDASSGKADNQPVADKGGRPAQVDGAPSTTDNTAPDGSRPDDSTPPTGLPAGDVARVLDPGRHSGVGSPATPDAQAPPPPLSPDRAAAVSEFLIHMFPIGHLPVATDSPARQVSAPPAEVDYAAGLRFQPGDHPVAVPTDQVLPVPDSPGGDSGDLADGHEPFGDMTEAEWTRRFTAPSQGHYRPVEYVWPPGELYPEGGLEVGTADVLPVGTVLDRFGTPEGRVFGLDGTPFARRALPPAHLAAGYRRYRVARPLPVWQATSAPWFAQPGGGERVRTTHPAVELVALGHLVEITPAETGPAETTGGER